MAPSHTYNVTSPVKSGPYVAGQILPCTYRLFSTIDTSGLDLYITLQITDPIPPPTTISSSNNSTNTTTTTTTLTLPVNGTYVIAEKADVSKTDAFLKQDGNLTFYEHSINFNIPTTVRPGNYKVTFLDRSTNTNLPIPIEIRPAAPTSSPVNGISPSGSTSSSSPGSIFMNDALSLYSSSSSFMITIMSIMMMSYLL
ncbi:unnamed protein product [Cunninghamella echinulata]